MMYVVVLWMTVDDHKTEQLATSRNGRRLTLLLWLEINGEDHAGRAAAAAYGISRKSMKLELAMHVGIGFNSN